MLTTQDKILIEQRIANDKPSSAVAYALLIFVGLLGAHRAYLGRFGSAIAMLIISLTVIGLAVTIIWVIVDLFLMPSILREQVEELRQKLTKEAQSNAESGQLA
jgi:TM2 domain-containing membrane protein YozV